MKSFAILRTNTGLTTNVKIMIDSDYNLSLDSIDSNYMLSQDRFKKFKFTPSDMYDDIISSYYSDFPVDQAFDIKYNNDNFHMNDNFSDQYDDIYLYGGRNIINNKNYEEEFEYFAPLYYTGVGELPSNFIIFRIDGHGIETLDASNFRDEIINKLKTVKVFDLTEKSKLGKWLNKSFVNNNAFPKAPLEMDFNSYEFSKWNGINYNNGGYISKTFYTEEILSSEREIFELEKLIFDNYKNSDIIFPNILNLTFLFNDKPSTPDYERNWSLNRYLGFYTDELERVKSISPYKLPKLKTGVVIEDNILTHTSDYPFIDEWDNSKPYYIEYDNEFYIVERYSEIRGDSVQSIDMSDYNNEEYLNNIFYYYKIITDLSLDGKENDINKNYGYINSDNILMDENGYITSNFLNIDDADVWIINIDGIYHNIVKGKDENDHDVFKLNTDYSFKFNVNTYEYKVASRAKTIKYIENFITEPVKFDIYKLNFTTIKDFDTRIIDTQYSRYEYEKEHELTNTDEPKMYFENPLSKTNPKEYDDFIFDDEVVNIPVSSEYTANKETFKINNNKLSEIWNINPVFCRWVYQNSLSDNDYPYLLNNSQLFGEYNKTVNPYISYPSRVDKNLDYFYTINPYSMTDKGLYLYHSLHIESYNSDGTLDKNFKFDFDKYLNKNYNGDYFTHIFERSQFFDNNEFKRNVLKYSQFNKGDISIPNQTVFKGIGFNIQDVENIQVEAGKISDVNVMNRNTFEDYKLSIIATDNTTCHMNWAIVKEWKIGEAYEKGDIVEYEDILYIAIKTNKEDQPYYQNNINKKNAPYLHKGDWIPYYYYETYIELTDPQLTNYITNIPNISYDHIFWIPDVTDNSTSTNFGTPQQQQNITPPSPYQDGDIIYYNGNYYSYKSDNNVNDNIWNPYKIYAPDDIVMYKDIFYKYKNVTSDNGITPDNTSHWEKTNDGVVLWDKISIWNPGALYQLGDKIIHLGILYKANDDTEIGDEPGVTIIWDRIYSLDADNNIAYNHLKSGNSLIFMNNTYYLYRSNSEKFLKLYSDNTLSITDFIIEFTNREDVSYFLKDKNNAKKFINDIHNGVADFTPCDSITSDGIELIECMLPPNININDIVGALTKLGIDITNCKLNNGIDIYINKRWKNILVNIYNNDNTLPYLKNSNRDTLYTELYESLTAHNFILNINDLNNKYGFVNNIKYIIIDEDGGYENYSLNNKIKELPYIINCFHPDSFKVDVDGINYKAIDTPKPLKPLLHLLDGKINNIYKLNWYNNIPIAYELFDNTRTRKILPNFNSLSNIRYYPMRRFSGLYMPLFHNLELFYKDSDSEVGNYIFDTSLTMFGRKQERLLNKVNRKGSILKLRNIEDEISIYPMIDEFGYTSYDWFIFKSTWDKDYHIELYPRKNYIETFALIKPIFDFPIIDISGICETMYQIIINNINSLNDLEAFIENNENYNICCEGAGTFWALGDSTFMESKYGHYEIEYSKGLGFINNGGDETIEEILYHFDSKGILQEIIDYFKGIEDYNSKILTWDCNEVKIEIKCPTIYELLYEEYMNEQGEEMMTEEEFEILITNFYNEGKHELLCCTDCSNIIYYGQENNQYVYNALIEIDVNLCCSNDITVISSGDERDDIIITNCIHYDSLAKAWLINDLNTHFGTSIVADDLIIINPHNKNTHDYTELYDIFNDSDSGKEFVFSLIRYAYSHLMISNCDEYSIIEFGCNDIYDVIEENIHTLDDFIGLTMSYDEYGLCCTERGYWAFGNAQELENKYPDDYIDVDIDSGLGVIGYINEYITLFDDKGILNEVADYFNGVSDNRAKIMIWDCNKIEIESICPNIFEIIYNKYKNDNLL